MIVTTVASFLLHQPQPSAAERATFPAVPDPSGALISLAMVGMMMVTNVATQLPVLIHVFEGNFNLAKVTRHLPALEDFQVFRAT